ncbi:MAG TPA: hypothetical protein VJ521_16460 [Acidobacteriota bacterium]|nr:hypothetical protein [Acidobacteriota bacterium]
MTHDDALVAALQHHDWELARLDEKDRALLNFARKLNVTPGDVRQTDIDQLRSAGFSDENIFDAVVLVAYFNFMNRIADGLGVEPEPEKQKSYETHMAEVLNRQRSRVVDG